MSLESVSGTEDEATRVCPWKGYQGGGESRSVGLSSPMKADPCFIVILWRLLKLLQVAHVLKYKKQKNALTLLLLIKNVFPQSKTII